MKTYIILVDVGNTSVSIALADSKTEKIQVKVKRLLTKQLARDSFSHAVKSLVGDRRVEGAALCSVVPATDRLLVSVLRNVVGCQPVQVSHELELGVEIKLKSPEKIGADRLANVCAASFLYDRPVIALDLGTATTFDVVTKDNQYIGGVIAPGLSVMTDYFAERTALLPRLLWTKHGAVLNGNSRVRRGRAIGQNTAEAMLIGAETGYVGMLREILTRIKEEMDERLIKVCATGGYAKQLLSRSSIDVEIDPYLTMRGIMRIYQMNK